MDDDPPEFIIEFLITNDNFKPLVRRMLTVDPVAHLTIEISNQEIRLRAINRDNDGFLVICGESRREFRYHFVRDNIIAGPPRGYGTVPRTEFIIQAVTILMTFLEMLGRNEPIGTFEVASYGEVGRVQYAQNVHRLKTGFFEHLQGYFISRQSRLRVSKFVMEYNGTFSANQEIHKFLPYIKLMGDAELVLKSCRDMRQPRELSLLEVYMLKSYARPKKLTVRRPFWTVPDAERWAEFREITTSCWELEVGDVEELIPRFRDSVIFRTCTITTNTLRPDIQTYFNRHFQRHTRGAGTTWRIRGHVRLQMNVEDFTMTFSKHLVAHDIFLDSHVIDREPFLPLNERMSSIQRVDDLKVEISDKGISIEVRNRFSQDFEVRFQAGGNEFRAGYQLENDPNPGFHYTNMRGNFIIEASHILASFLSGLQEDSVIGCFKVTELYDPVYELQMRIIKSTFLAQMEQYFRKRFWPLLVNRFVMKYSGSWEARTETYAFLPYMKMVGAKEVVLQSSGMVNEFTELMLDTLPTALSWTQPDKLIVKGMFYTAINLPIFRMFKEISTNCRTLSLEDVTLLLWFFRFGCPEFRKCTIRVVDVVDPLIKQMYEENLEPTRFDQNGIPIRWMYPRIPFSVGIDGNVLTFRNTAR